MIERDVYRLLPALASRAFKRGPTATVLARSLKLEVELVRAVLLRLEAQGHALRGARHRDGFSWTRGRVPLEPEP